MFDKLRKKDPNFSERLTAITGNVLEENIGLSDNETTLVQLKEKIDVVFHLAGSVNLDEDLKTSLLLNVCGLRNTLTFAKKLTNLQVS